MSTADLPAPTVSAIQEAGAPSLIHALRQLHPTSAFVATQAPEFDLVKFTSASANNASFTKVAAPDHVFLRQFAPPARRIDGLGTLVDKSIFGVFDLTWNGREFRIYSAEWREGFGQARQHHIVAETEEEADLLVLAVSTFSTSLHEAILVFDQSHWTPDHQLWQSIQKVRLSLFSLYDVEAHVLRVAGFVEGRHFVGQAQERRAARILIVLQV